MPEFTGTKRDGQLIYDDYRSRDEWIRKLKEGQRFRDRMSRIAGKTSPQLGYYWGLLLPEIHKQYLRDGQVVRIFLPRINRLVERKPTMEDSHITIKDICGLVGDDGIRLDVSDMDEFQMTKFIDNVLFHAVNDLLMNGEALEAKRPEKEVF